MGMDVYGKKPKTPAGEYFRSNVWYWRPLWVMIEELYPEIASEVEYAQSNDGDGLSYKSSIALAQLLEKDILSGKIDKYIEDYNKEKESIPPDDCTYCNNLGTRDWPSGDTVITKVCNACNGTLKVPNYLQHYYMDINLIKEFQIFLANCGGFEIW